MLVVKRSVRYSFLFCKSFIFIFFIFIYGINKLLVKFKLSSKSKLSRLKPWLNVVWIYKCFYYRIWEILNTFHDIYFDGVGGDSSVGGGIFYTTFKYRMILFMMENMIFIKRFITLLYWFNCYLTHLIANKCNCRNL